VICFEDDCEHREGRYGHHPGDLYCYGRCRSGRRWFWAVVEPYPKDQDEMRTEHGWADTEDRALVDARAAVERLIDGRPGVAVFRVGFASEELKRVNAERRWYRPDPGTSDAWPVEYLYARDRYGCDDSGDYYGPCPCRALPRQEAWQYHLVPFRITKKTAKRIYYVRRESRHADELEVGFVDRQKLEVDGEVSNRGVHWSQVDSHLYAATDPPEGWQRWRPAESTVELSRLRVEMADAHPDRGGSAAAFMEARRRYLLAKGLVR
jgi:hypothetical protein